MKVRRPYRMRARAASVEETRARLVDAMLAQFAERPFADITLESVAADAGVSQQTLLRHFGSKPGLVAATSEVVAARIASQRGAAPVGDPAGAVANLFDHYEEWGDLVLRLLAQEDRLDELAESAAQGRALHAAWVERVFGPQLAAAGGERRQRLRAQLITVCDVLAWRVLRRDLGLSRLEAQAAVVDLVEALCAPRSP